MYLTCKSSTFAFLTLILFFFFTFVYVFQDCYQGDTKTRDSSACGGAMVAQRACDWHNRKTLIGMQQKHSKSQKIHTSLTHSQTVYANGEMTALKVFVKKEQQLYILSK